MAKDNTIDGLAAKGDPARLIPVLPDSRREERVTSVLMAVLQSVDEYGRDLLSAAGAPIRKRTTIECYTEVCFNGADKKISRADRPDGLIVLRYGKEVWTAIIEAKIGGAKLDEEQITRYIDLARASGIDAVITISNQFTARTQHHPVAVPKTKLRKTSLLHWSWSYILSEAVIKSDTKGVADPDQAFILQELIRFLQHERTGVQAFTQMPSEWPGVCKDMLVGPLNKRGTGVAEVVASWQQLTRSMALRLSEDILQPVVVHLPKAHAVDPAARDDHDTRLLCEERRFEDSFRVPGAADTIQVIADGQTRTLTASMTLRAPTDKKRASATVTWIRRQLDACPEPDKIVIAANWPGRTPPTYATLAQINEDPQEILQDDSTRMPSSFDVRMTIDLGGEFRRNKRFVEACVDLLPSFYASAGQHLQAWRPAPPKVSAKSAHRSDGGNNEARSEDQEPAA